jgi:hypothetical protein
MNNNEFLHRFLSLTPAEGWEVWVGSLGYDTRPRIVGGPSLPVDHRVGCAESGREGYDVPAGDLAAAVRAVPVGFAVSVPDFSGAECVGEWMFTRTDHGWTEVYA